MSAKKFGGTTQGRLEEASETIVSHHKPDSFIRRILGGNGVERKRLQNVLFLLEKDSRNRGETIVGEEHGFRRTKSGAYSRKLEKELNSFLQVNIRLPRLPLLESNESYDHAMERIYLTGGDHIEYEPEIAKYYSMLENRTDEEIEDIVKNTSEYAEAISLECIEPQPESLRDILAGCITTDKSFYRA